MRRKSLIVTAAGLLVASVGFFLVQSHRLFLTHEALANQAVRELLANTERRLAKSAAGQEELTGSEAADLILLYEVVEWQVEDVQLSHTHALWQSIRDDDPVYGLDVALDVTLRDGSEAVLSWESWRYGLVLGPVIVGYGDGPPGEVAFLSK